MEFVEITAHCGYISEEAGLICPKIGIVHGSKGTIYFDTGASLKQIRLLECVRLEKGFKNPSILVVSHFHEDHIANFHYFAGCRVYASKVTARRIRVDEITDGRTMLDLGDIKVEIIPLPSSHAKGSLILRVFGEEVVFLGDGVYEAVGFGEKGYYDRSLFHEMAGVLRSLQSSHYVFGHESLLPTDDQVGMESFLLRLEKQIKTAGEPRFYID